MSKLLLEISAAAAAFYASAGVACVVGFRLGLRRADAARFAPSAWLAVFLCWPLFVIRGAVALVDSWRLGR